MFDDPNENLTGPGVDPGDIKSDNLGQSTGSQPLDDMFSPMDAGQGPTIPQKSAPKPVLASGALANLASKKPVLPNPDGPAAPGGDWALGNMNFGEEKSKSSLLPKMIIVILSGLFVLIVIILGFRYLLSSSGNRSTSTTKKSDVYVPPVSNTQATPATEPAKLDSDSDGLTDEEELKLGADPRKADTDGDGLTDYEEVKTYGTNPLKADTDSDGLTDYEEVKIYHTNPLNQDTDGDTYKDGDEVKNGFDPNKGGGAKLVVPAMTTPVQK